MFDPTQYGFRRDRFDIGWVSQLGVTLSDAETQRVIQIILETQAARAGALPRRKMLKAGFEQLKEAVGG